MSGFLERRAVKSFLKKGITNYLSPLSFPLEGEENIYEPDSVHSHACEAHVFHYVVGMEQSIKEGK